MAVIADPDGSDAPNDAAVRPTPARRYSEPSFRTVLLAALPAIMIGLLIRAWVMRSALLAMNSDEALTGLQSWEVLSGRFRLIVAGNDYGATTETYLFAPILAIWSGVWPLRVMSALLSVAAAFALYRLAAPLFGRVVAIALSLIGWTASGAIVLLWSRPYMGYTTGFIAQVAAVALACHAMRTTQRLARTALLAGFAAGFAIWSHPMFGAVALLALAVPSVYRWREFRRWWLCLAAGGLVGVAPWLLFIYQNGRPESALPTVRTTYSERALHFLTELLPRAFGLRAPDGTWLSPSVLAVAAAAVLIIGSLSGLVLLVVRRGAQGVPILVAGVLAFPTLAVFTPLGFVADGRYALPFLPQLLMGLGAWSLLLPGALRRSPWLIAVLPTVWALVLCVPIIHHQSGWDFVDPDQDAKQVVSELHSRDFTYLAGDYWGTYLVDYLADRSLQVTTNGTVRLKEEAAVVTAANPSDVAYIFAAGQAPRLRMRIQDYQLINVGAYDLYVPLQPAG
jgi:hypothetical protein